MSRTAAALFLVPPVLALILLAPGWGFLLVAEVVTLVAVHELYGMAGRRGNRPLIVAGCLSAALLTASFYYGGGEVQWAALFLVLAVGVAALRRGAPGAGTFDDISATVLGAAYVGLLSGSVVGLRMTTPDIEGRSWVLFLLLVVLLGDTGAYYTGTAWGRTKLASAISPKKTVEGLVGGVTVSVATAALAGPFLLPDLDWPVAAVLGLTLSLTGVAGDLFESTLKRSVGVKDTSAIIPGHGGILDRLDSVLFSAPALLAYVRIVHPRLHAWLG